MEYSTKNLAQVRVNTFYEHSTMMSPVYSFPGLSVLYKPSICKLNQGSNDKGITVYKLHPR